MTYKMLLSELLNHQGKIPTKGVLIFGQFRGVTVIKPVQLCITITTYQSPVRF